MILNDLTANFPNLEIPSLLEEVCRLEEIAFNSDQNFLPSPDGFELAHPDEDEIGYFINKEGAEKQLVLFGQDGKGSFFGFWLYDDTEDLSTAPIIYLCSEGVNSSVIASEFDSFLGLLATSFFEYWEDWTEDEESEIDEELVDFIDWLDDQGITPPEDPLDYVESAREEFPDFDEWLNTYFDESLTE